MLDALADQTCAPAIEVVLVDLEPEQEPLNPLLASAVYVPMPPAATFAKARAAGALRAKAPVVAFIEDHCYPTRQWAEALIEAHRGPWAAVGYAFTNANPDNYVARSAMVLDYGLWTHPAAGGGSELLPYNNCSYKRETLLSLGPALEHSLTPDFNVHRELTRRGLGMCIEPRALAAHENFTRLGDLTAAQYHYCRHLAARRVREGWSPRRRAIYAVATPFGAPLVGLGRLLRSLRGRASLVSDVMTAFPVILVGALAGAVGESIGYAIGEGNSERAANFLEVDAARGLGE